MTDLLPRTPMRRDPAGTTGSRARGLATTLMLLAVLLPFGPGAQAQSPTPARPAAASQPPALPSAAPRAPQANELRRSGDFIVAVVNRELVTNGEVLQRAAQAERGATRSGATLPPREELLRIALDQLIDDRAQLSHARDSIGRIEESEVDRAVGAVAAQNQLTVAQLRERLRSDGQDYQRFRDSLRDQMLLDRVRDRDVQARIRISDADIENWLAEQRAKAGLSTELNIAQILITLPENASAAEISERRLRAVHLLQRLKAGEDFAALVREASAGGKDKGGELGMRRADKLPDLFVDAVMPLRPGEVAPQVLRSGAGFHVLKLVDRKEANLAVVQHHARHILLRLGPRLTQDAAVKRLMEYKRLVDARRARFEDLARQHSEDGSAASGGDLGWAGPGQFVPEFEQALLALPAGAVSEPVVSRFGVHLIQLVERRSVDLNVREQREAARNALREAKYDEAYADWAREIRARAYVELRDPPGP
jgi:peptidyl-prolyl cis-trans isomerase SurA